MLHSFTRLVFLCRVSWREEARSAYFERKIYQPVFHSWWLWSYRWPKVRNDIRNHYCKSIVTSTANACHNITVQSTVNVTVIYIFWCVSGRYKCDLCGLRFSLCFWWLVFWDMTLCWLEICYWLSTTLNTEAARCLQTFSKKLPTQDLQ